MPITKEQSQYMTTKSPRGSPYGELRLRWNKSAFAPGWYCTKTHAGSRNGCSAKYGSVKKFSWGTNAAKATPNAVQTIIPTRSIGPDEETISPKMVSSSLTDW